MGSDDSAPADASHLTPEEKRGPSTLHVALLLLVALLVLSVLTSPEKVLPRDSTLHGAHHADEESGLDVPVPVGWKVQSAPVFGSVQIVPTGTGQALSTRILAGRLDPGTAAAAISDDRAAAMVLAETVQQYVMKVAGLRDDLRFADVENEIGPGASASYVVVPTEGGEGAGGLVYAAVFGSGADRAWLAYLTTSQTSTPGAGWVDRLVADVREAS